MMNYKPSDTALLNAIHKKVYELRQATGSHNYSDLKDMWLILGREERHELSRVLPTVVGYDEKYPPAKLFGINLFYTDDESCIDLVLVT